jgi:hypothetical protein
VLGANLPRVPEALLLARDRGQVLFIVGAGASYPAPSLLPDFSGLVASIYQQVDTATAKAIDLMQKPGGPTWDKIPLPLDDWQRTELKFFSQQEYDVVLGMLERRIDGSPGHSSAMRVAARQILSATSTPNVLHTSLLRLGRRFGQTLLATTNFDRLLTIAAKAEKVSAPAFALGNIPSPSRGIEFSGLMHIHGMLGHAREQASALVLTDQDFGDYYLRRHVITSFLYDAARIFSLVLVGYSANDSPVRYLLNAIAGDERHFDDLKPRYAFVGHKSGDTRTPVEWTARGITPVSYDTTAGHAPLSDLLVRWSELTPETSNKKTISDTISTIAKTDPDLSAASDAVPLFQYLVRRSTSIEVNDIVRLLSSVGASGKWINVLSKTHKESY